MGPMPTNLHAGQEATMVKGKRMKLPFLLTEEGGRSDFSPFTAVPKISYFVPETQNKERHPWNFRISKNYLPTFQNFEGLSSAGFSGWKTSV